MTEKNKILTNDSMTSVVTPIGYILDEFLNYIEGWDKDLAYVHDDQLSYETGVAKWRKDNSIQVNNDKPLPLFIFRRSVMRAENEKGIGERSRQFSIVAGDKQYQTFYGAFDIDFLYVTRSMLDLERFELTYLMQSGFSKKKTLSVDFPELSKAEYNMEFGVLDEKTINIDNSYYKVLSGTFTVRGLFFMFSKDVKLIKNIRATISDYIVETCEPTEVLGKITITANENGTKTTILE